MEPGVPAFAETYKPYPSKYADACYEAQDHDSADLCAQWRAAMAAEKAANTAGWGNWIAGGGAALSFISTVLVVVALGQGRKANRIASDTAKRQLRAYVFVTGAKMSRFKVDRSVMVTVAVSNSGQTPAYRLQAWIDLMTGGNKDTKAFPDCPAKALSISTIDLGPGAEIYLRQSNDPDILTEWQGLRIKTDNEVIYVHGRLTYLDCFGRRYNGRFRYSYSGVQYRNSIESMMYCTEGNEYDREGQKDAGSPFHALIPAPPTQPNP